MDRKKKKQVALKSAANVELQRKALKERFLDRSKKLILSIGGDTLLAKFPAIYLDKLYECRYPTLKAKPAPGLEIPKTRIVQFNKLILQLTEEVEIPLPNGNKIPLSWYLSEGLTLRDSINEIDPTGDPRLAEIKSSFIPFQHNGKFHHQLQETLIELVTEICTLLSNYEDCIYRADLNMTPYFAQYNPQNDVLIHIFKPKKENITTVNGIRNAIRLGWASPKLTWENFNVKPSLLGFPTKGLDIPVELYISSHLFVRLNERINITPGIMHQILLFTFLQNKIPHRWMGDCSHVEFTLSGQKAGYLLVKMHQNKLIIHTFLFLTNDGTYEGNKFNRMLTTAMPDKVHMKIDTLPAFNSYHFDKDELLSKMFKDAGCGSLLKLGHLQQFSINQEEDKDPESIKHYLADAPYFKR